MEHKLISLIKQEFPQVEVKFRPGDTIKLHYKVIEGEKERVQVFEGVVIALRSANFVVRKVTLGVGIERIIPKNSPYIQKIEVVKRGKVRRAKLYYLRGLSGKKARIKELIK